MKKLIVFMLVAIPLLIVQAQQTDILSLGRSVGEGISYSDSLRYGTPGDSVMIIKWSNRFSYPQIYLEGDTTTIADSLAFRTGMIMYTSRGVALDTVWGSSRATLKDSVWGNTFIAINNTVGKEYTIYSRAFELLEIRLLNTRANRPVRKVRFTISARPDVVKPEE